jgi:hypothetical protein
MAETAINVDTTLYELANSYILDSGLTSHICNDWTRFRNYRKTTNEAIITGNSTALILSYNDIDITLEYPSRKRVITLENTAFIPTFQTNITSLQKFISKEVY